MIDDEVSYIALWFTLYRRQSGYFACRKSSQVVALVRLVENAGNDLSSATASGRLSASLAGHLLRHEVSHANRTTTQQPLERRINGREFSVSARTVEP